MNEADKKTDFHTVLNAIIKWQDDVDKKLETLNGKIEKVDKKVDNLYISVDNKVKQKIRRIAIKYLDVRWQAMGVWIALMGIHLGLVYLISKGV